MNKYKYLFMFGVPIAMLVCIFTLPEFISVVDGTCVQGEDLWSYRINILSWIVLGILILIDTERRRNEKTKGKNTSNNNSN